MDEARQSDPVTPPATAVRTASADAVESDRRWVRYDRLAVQVLVTFQLVLYVFWSVTQFEAAPGSWWQPLFHRSGPTVLPLMFGLQLALIAAAAPLAWVARASLRRQRPVLLLSFLMAVGILTIPLSYLDHFGYVKIWKDVAFLTGYALVPIALLLSITAVRRFFFLLLVLGLVGGALGLAEAMHRASLEHLTTGGFLLNPYRVYAGGQYTELVLLFGAVAIWRSYARAWRQARHAVLMLAFVYTAIRFRLYFTRLYWLALGLTLLITVGLVLPRHAKRSALIAGIVMGSIFIVMTPILSNYADITNRLTPANNVSLEFRAKESELLAQKVIARPVTGWGPGGTISPNLPQEPARNDTSSFFDGYLGVAYKFGLPALGLLLAAVALAILEMARALRRSLSRLDAAVIAGAATYLVAALVTSSAQDLFFSNFSALPLGLLTGIGLRLSEHDAQPIQAADRRPERGPNA